MPNEVKPIETISLEPKWTVLMPVILVALENGTDTGKANARRSLAEFAARVDAARDMQRRMHSALDALAKAWPKVFGMTDAEREALREASEVVALTLPRSIAPPHHHDARERVSTPHSATLIEDIRECVESVLCNDESSSDEELVQLFVTEWSLSLDDATAIVARRSEFLRFMPTIEQPRIAW